LKPSLTLILRDRAKPKHLWRTGITTWFFAQRAKRDSVVANSNNTRPDHARTTARPSRPRITGWHRLTRRVSAGAATVVLIAAAAFLTAAPAYAAPSPGWRIESSSTPTNFTTTDEDSYTLTAIDVGAAPTDGSEVIITDTLPSALKVQGASLRWSGNPPEGERTSLPAAFCTTAPLRCAIPASFFTEQGKTVQPGDTIRMSVFTAVLTGAPEGPLLNAVAVEGGGAPRAETEAENQLTAALPAFGAAAFSSYFADPAGQAPTQAGEHPYGLTTSIDLANALLHTPETNIADTSVEDLRDVLVDLPPGLAGSALSASTCTFAQLGSAATGGTGANQCPAASVVGHLRTSPPGPSSIDSPIFNMTPERGQFAVYDNAGASHVLDASLVPSPAGYLLRVTSPEISQITLTKILSSFFGDPAARDAGRGPQAGDLPTFSNPADCSGEPLITTIHMDSWQNPGTYNPDGSPNLAEPNWVTKPYEAPPVSGCDKLAGLFKPKIEATPTTNQADKPTGLDVNLKVPQAEGIETLATPPLKKAVVTLPAGMSVNPSSANGLGGCSLAQIGVSASGQPNAAAPDCPDASKIGSVELETPALSGVLQGSIYVAKQSENPFKSLLAIYIVVNDPKTGVIVKLPGEIRADPATGQLTTVIDDNPQFPFSELRTHFFAGQKAALRTPAVCGKYEVTSELTPWSAPQSGPPAEPSAAFEITQGCASSAATEPNHPAFSAGTLSPLAGAYSPFVLKLSREDGAQELKGLSVALPAGLIGKLAGVQECSEAQLAAASARGGLGQGALELSSPSCPASSEVGTVTAGAGAGLTPFYASGHAYLAGPYKGAPLSLAVITPAVAGPFDLGTVVIRNALQVNPETAQITAVSDEIPHILQGIPLDIRQVALNMNKPDFTLNPTSCEKKSITGSATSVLGQSTLLSNPFQVGGCKGLGFKPKLSLALKGSVKRTANPALIANLTYPKGSYANVASAQVKLPPSAFLDNAHIGTVCTRVQFTAAAQLGAGCPAGSVYGRVRAVTPLLDQPLQGNVYLRSSSHKLPDLVAALGGQIEVALVGRTDSVKGALRNTFEAVPDAPVTSFRLELFGGKKGLIQMSSGFCAHPNATVNLTGQNGKVFDTTPKVAAKCPKPKKHKGHPGAGHHKRHPAA
jgi:hypothetical protein